VVGGAALAASNSGATSINAAAVWAAVNAEDASTVVVDIRNKAETTEQGSPDFKGVKGRRLVTLAATQVWARVTTTRASDPPQGSRARTPPDGKHHLFRTSTSLAARLKQPLMPTRAGGW
jgi:hypothetical protein